MSTKLLCRMLESGIDGMREEWELEKYRKRKSYAIPMDTPHTKVNMVDKFLDMVSAILRKTK